jgi:hypothetical protein
MLGRGWLANRDWQDGCDLTGTGIADSVGNEIGDWSWPFEVSGLGSMRVRLVCNGNVECVP